MADSTRRILTPVLLAIAIVAAIAIAWCGIWYFAATKAEATIKGWLAREAQLGRSYSCAQQSIEGFPLRFELRCVGAQAQLGNLVPPLRLDLADAVVRAQLFEPTLLTADFTGPLSLGDPGAPARIRASWSRARTSVHGLPIAPERIAIALDDPSFADAAGRAMAGGKHAELQVRLASGTPLDHPVLDVTFNLAAAAAPAIHRLLIEPVDADLDTTLRGLTSLAPKPLPDYFRELQRENGRIEIRRVRVKQGEWLAAGAGSVGLTPAGRLDGEIRITVAGLDKLLQALGVEYLSRPSAGSDRVNAAINALDRLIPGLGQVARDNAGVGLAAGATALGEPATLEGRRAVTLPLRFQDGTVFLGPLQVGQTEPLF